MFISNITIYICPSIVLNPTSRVLSPGIAHSRQNNPFRLYTHLLSEAAFIKCQCFGQQLTF